MFKMVLMLEAMGINLLIRYKATPTTINTMTRLSKGIFELLLESVTSNLLPKSEAHERAMDYICAGSWETGAAGTLNAETMRGAEGEWQRGDHACHPLGLNRAALNDATKEASATDS
jgi:hypothetical protein